MSEQIGAVLVFVGLFLATSGLLVLIGRSLRVLLGRTERRRLLGPAALLAAGLVIGAVPLVAQHLYFSIVGRAERERVVNGRPALVLTGWDRRDYSILATKPGTEILEMGNADVTDAMNLLVVPEGRLGLDLAAAGVGARFHKGFVDAIAAIWPVLLPAIEAEVKKCDRPIWITGHSLGGALALIAAWLLKRKFIAVEEVCTFGAPMIGNRTAGAAFNREFAGKIHRYVNGRDPVPKLPGLSLVANEFVHVDRERLLGSHPMTGLVEVVGGVAGKAVNGLLAGTLIDEAWKGINAEVATHFLDCYRELLRG